MRRHQSEVVGRQRTAEGPQAKLVGLVDSLVRDEGVAGSNPATPTSFLVAPITYAASYAEQNSRVIISRPRFMPIRSLGRSRERWLSLPAFGGPARAPMRRLLPPAQMRHLL